jgi:hypothetical protein
LSNIEKEITFFSDGSQVRLLNVNTKDNTRSEKEAVAKYAPSSLPSLPLAC